MKKSLTLLLALLIMPLLISQTISVVKAEENGQQECEHDWYRMKDYSHHWIGCLKCSAIQEGSKEAHSFGEPSYVWSGPNSRCTGHVSCTVCEYEIYESPMSEAIRTDSTCVSEGSIVYKVSFAQHYFTPQTVTEILPKRDHNLFNIPAVEATCRFSGNYAYSQCTSCRQYFDASGQNLIAENSWVIPAKGHSFTHFAPKEATCTEPGNKEFWQCNTCGMSYSDASGNNEVAYNSMIILETGHSMISYPAKESTCTEAGNWAYWYCTKCGKYYVDSTGSAVYGNNNWVIQPQGHWEIVDEKIESTCTENGLTEGVHCGDCGVILKQQTIIKAVGHNIVVDKEVSASCQEKGKTEGSHCSICGEVIVEQKTVPKLAHNKVIDKAIEPTCQSSGLTEGSHCSICGEVIVEQKTVPKLAHNKAIDKAIEPTCQSSGLTEGSHCSVCGEVITAQRTIPKLAHNKVIDKAIEPTCQSSGLTEGSHCSICGETLVVQTIIEKQPHKEVSENEKKASCTEMGLSPRIYCSVCGEVIAEQEEIPALGHQFTAWIADENGNHFSKCYRCGESQIVNCTMIKLQCEKTTDMVFFCPICGHCIDIDCVEKLTESKTITHDSNLRPLVFLLEIHKEKYLLIAFEKNGILAYPDNVITVILPEQYMNMVIYPIKMTEKEMLLEIKDGILILNNFHEYIKEHQVILLKCDNV